MYEYIYKEADRLARKFMTRDPFELLDYIGAVTRFSNEYERNGLKGYSMIMTRTKYATINARLRRRDQEIVAGHKGAHLIIHPDEIMSSPVRMLKDFNLFDDSGRIEYQANLFLADFLLSDEDVLDSVFDEDKDFFSSARELFVPPPLFAFKLYSLMRRGYDVRSPIDLDSKFLGR